MKKILHLVLAMLVLLTLVACQSDGETSSSDSETNSTSSEVAPVTYTISWYDENGTLLKSQSVEEGAVPTHSYTVTDTAEWDYTLDGWSSVPGGDVLSSVPTASADASYYASVSKVKQKYTVTFHSNGGSAVNSQTVEYGALASEPEAPKYDGHKFIAWAYDEAGSVSADFTKPIEGNVDFYAVWNEVTDIKALLSSLLNGYKLNPFASIPQTMLESYTSNLVDADDIVTDYSENTSISSITYGFGEQWHMVLSNLIQSKTFFDTLNTVDELVTVSVSTFNNYFDSNPSNTAHHSFKSGIYNVTIDFDGEIISYVLDYSTTLPVLGEQTVQIALSMNADTYEKTARIQLGDANALTYKILEDSYEFAIKYLGIRRAYFSVETDESGMISGKIYEYLTVSGLDAEIASAADFYITEDYVSVVGNKADGIIGFTNYICELYNAKNGKLLAYEVREESSLTSYDTLWFNLDDISGLTSIKYVPGESGNPATIYVNGSSNAWKAKKVLLSRRFDIEFRTQFVYSYDAATNKYTEHKISVPMLFVQADYLDSFSSDVEDTNNLELTISVSSKNISQLENDYEELIPTFIENKEAITSQMIVDYIGEKFIFE